jgi:hypothetical protein
MDSAVRIDYVAEAVRLFRGTVMPPPHFRPGTSFKNGKLYVFSTTRIIVMAPWPEMRAWTKTRARPKWRPCRPFIRLWSPDLAQTYVHDRLRRWDGPWMPEGVREEDAPLPEDLADMELDEDTAEECERIAVRREQQEAREAVGRERFFSTIPRSLVSLVEAFPQRQWHLLSLLARCPGASDLLHSTPALAYALASNWVFHRPAVQRPLRAARALLQRKQRRIAGWLGFPETEAAIRVLRKLQPSACLSGLLLRLRDRMKDPATLRLLGHLPPLDAAGLLLVLRPETAGWVTPSLLEQAHVASQTLDCARHLAEILEMRRILNDPRPARRLTSITRLRILHDDLVERMNRAGLKMPEAAPFPAPPFPGNDALVPITTADELFAEGRHQDNCVGAYASRVRRGRCYIYRLLAPERATVEVVLRKSGWRLGEIEARENQPVCPETERQVQTWLESESAAQRAPSAVRD